MENPYWSRPLPPQSGKLVVSGSVMEFFLYERDIWAESEELRAYRKSHLPGDRSKRLQEESLEDPEEKARLSGLRSARGLRRLVNANCGRYYDPQGKPFKPIFLTFTFAENLIDVQEANLRFKKFMMRFNYFLKTRLKYVAVIEFQERGAIHYHVIFFNLPYVPNLIPLLNNQIWGYGWCFSRGIENIVNVGSYVVKYMSKKFEEYGENIKLYQASKGLYKPIIMRSIFRISDVLSLIPFDGSVMVSDLDSVYCGYFKYIRLDASLFGYADLGLLLQRSDEFMKLSTVPSLSLSTQLGLFS